ncbi:class I SAM-dependent methyltransferase [Lentibacillus sp. CBA3610]|uniref:class I SAM-dependent methyltransferase n=1 Tax=Lentibacillus sp. CBA3610 TaxID=2518176 RepID=UPI001595FC3B|nr:class I SAM-dependent methyltransferase [Lentibacillus sp. CBA3610]QKY71410.1 class I SAM-dependent methyltransferase [Lentibacillus sp. CBA3610]
MSRSDSTFLIMWTSIDISQEMMSEGQSEQKGLSNIDYQIADAENLPFKQESFDLVISRLGFHHFTDPGRILHEMNKVCVP